MRKARRPFATSASIRNYYKRGVMLAKMGNGSIMKLTMMGLGNKGSVNLRYEKLMRRAGTQLPGAKSKTKRLYG